MKTRTPHDKLAEEAKEWDEGKKTPEGFINTPEALPYIALKRDFEKLVNRMKDIDGVCEFVGHLRDRTVGHRFTCLICKRLLDVDPEDTSLIVP